MIPRTSLKEAIVGIHAAGYRLPAQHITRIKQYSVKSTRARRKLCIVADVLVTCATNLEHCSERNDAGSRSANILIRILLEHIASFLADHESAHNWEDTRDLEDKISYYQTHGSINTYSWINTCIYDAKTLDATDSKPSIQNSIDIAVLANRRSAGGMMTKSLASDPMRGELY